MTAQGGSTAEPEVTVVITTRNRPTMVGEAVDSALAQTVGAVEVVVVDDASTRPVRLTRANDRLRIVRNARSGGVCAARNRGLAAARGRWITFLDDDDRLLPDMLERSLEAARASTLPPPVAALSAIEEVDEAGRTIRILLPGTLPRSRVGVPAMNPPGAPAAHATLVVPTDVARAIGGWDETLRVWEHTDLFLRLQAACSVQGVERVTYRRRVHKSRLSENLPARVDSMRRTLDKHEAAFARHPSCRARYLGAMGIAWLRMGHWDLAMVATTRSLWLAPFRPRGIAQWLASLGGPRIWDLLDPARARFRPHRDGS
jgi:glycosyltransferase involved in cell wall biosynthesis